MVVSNLGEHSGKSITDRLRQLLPGLPLCGFRRESPPGAPQDADRTREILVVELSSGEAAAALLDRAARRPDALHPFQLRAGVGVAVAAAAPASLSIPARGAAAGAGVGAAPLRPAAAPSEGGSGGGGEAASSAGGRWGQSVLAGRLKPRTVPPPATTELRPTLFSAMMEQQQRKVSKVRKGGVAGAEVNARLAAAEELRPGQVMRSNRWEGLLSDDEEEEGAGAGKAGAGAGAGEAPGKESEGPQEEGEGAHGDGGEQAADGDADASARALSAASSEHGDGEAEEGGEEEDEWEDEEDDMEVEVACPRCTFIHSADFCPMCEAPRK